MMLMENPSAIMKWQMDSINVKLLCQQSLHSLTIVATTETVFKRTENSFLKNLKRCRRSARNQTNVLINRTGFHDNNGANVEGESSLRRFSFNLLIVECELDATSQLYGRLLVYDSFEVISSCW